MIDWNHFHTLVQQIPTLPPGPNGGRYIVRDANSPTLRIHESDDPASLTDAIDAIAHVTATTSGTPKCYGIGRMSRIVAQNWRPDSLGRKAADFILNNLPPAAQVAVWDMTPEDHADAVLAGLTSLTFVEHCRRLEDVEAALTARGCTVLRIRATVAQVLQTMSEHNLPRDSSGVAAATALLADLNH